MNVALVCGIGLLGGLGAVARFLLDGAVAARTRGSFPWGTLTVNLAGTFGLGVLVGAVAEADVLWLFGTGLLGAFTTFSTWALESHRLGEDGQLGLGIANFVVSLVLGLAVAWLGQQLGAAW